MIKTEQGYFFIGKYTRGNDAIPQLAKMAADGWEYQDSFPAQDGHILVMRRESELRLPNGKVEVYGEE